MNNEQTDGTSGTPFHGCLSIDTREILARVESDPHAMQALHTLQENFAGKIVALIDQVAVALAEENKPDTRGPMGGLQNGRSLLIQGRRQEMDIAQRRQFAEALVIGALLNCDNPDWDGANPSTYQTSTQSSMLALLQMAPASQPLSG